MTICGGTIFDGVNENVPTDQFALDLLEFVGWLRGLHSRVLRTKDSNRLLCPSLFSTTRAIANVIETTGIWLDNDQGGMSPEQLADSFPDLRMVAFNTFSTTDAIRKYRVFIPTGATMGARVYSYIVREIIRQVAAINPNHGFDLGPSHAAALFYLPCQAQEQESSFFLDYDGGNRQPLDVRAWTETAVAHRYRMPPRPNNHSNAPTDVGKIKAALSRIPADCERDVWFRVLCALSNELGDGGFALADAWSRTGSKYDAGELERQWNDIRKRRVANPVSIATVVWMANQVDPNWALPFRLSETPDFDLSLYDETSNNTGRGDS
jgi:hypothetical protein